MTIVTDINFPDVEFGVTSCQQAGWDQALLDLAFHFAGSHNSSQFLVCHQGNIVKQQSWGCEPLDTGDIYSAQKSIVAVLIGIAQEKGLLNIMDPVNKYLDSGWSQTTAEQEQAITLRDLLTMTTGLNDDLEISGTRGVDWWYNTPAYQLLKPVLNIASGEAYQLLTREWITQPLGMNNTSWQERSFMNDSFGKPATGIVTSMQDMARFGLMILAGGAWMGQAIVKDQQFFKEMLSPSQQDNPAYGYLWWVNGQQSYRVPTIDRPFEGKMVKHAPDDMVFCLGAADQKIYVIPQWSTVICRRGGPGFEQKLASSSFDNALWEKLAAARLVNV